MILKPSSIHHVITSGTTHTTSSHLPPYKLKNIKCEGSDVTSPNVILVGPNHPSLGHTNTVSVITFGLSLLVVIEATIIIHQSLFLAKIDNDIPPDSDKYALTTDLWQESAITYLNCRFFFLNRQ